MRCIDDVIAIEGSLKSPIFQSFAETLTNRLTIRAFGSQQRFTEDLYAQSDEHLKVFLTIKLLERWTSFYLNLIAGTITCVLVVVAVMTRGAIDVTVVGLALVYCLQLLGLTSWTMMTFVALESYGTSCERLLHLLDIAHEDGAAYAADSSSSTNPNPNKNKMTTTKGMVAIEATPGTAVQTNARHGGGAAAADDWPSVGEIVFDNVQLRYRPELPCALKGLSLTVKGGEKIGIVGRTGAGKSSIMTALLRLFEAEAGSRILIDNVDITTVDLKRLRSSIALIPQDPLIFPGTVRTNLDPLSIYSDDAIWRALGAVRLSGLVQKATAGLHLPLGVGDDGIELSHGQQQLICIARALLRGCRILICDEATSSVDDETDQLVQDIIRTNFGAWMCSVGLVTGCVELGCVGGRGGSHPSSGPPRQGRVGVVGGVCVRASSRHPC